MNGECHDKSNQEARDRGDPPPIGSGGLTGLQFVRKLAELGADVNLRLNSALRAPHTASRLGMEGATAFLMAADRADVPFMELLLELGADPFIPNVEGSTPLMAAAGLGTTAPEEEAGSEAEARDEAEEAGPNIPRRRGERQLEGDDREDRADRID